MNYASKTTDAAEATGDTRFRHFTGLLSPKGKFYPCSSWEHEAIHRQLKEAGDPEAVGRYWSDSGFLHVSAGEWWDWSRTITPTQAQIDYVFDWSRACEGREFPTWLNRVAT